MLSIERWIQRASERASEPRLTAPMATTNGGGGGGGGGRRSMRGPALNERTRVAPIAEARGFSRVLIAEDLDLAPERTK